MALDVFFYEDPKLNFGDDLNRVLWREVLPKAVLESDRLLLVGIGSILNAANVGAIAGSPRTPVVMGSGTSYGTAPTDLSRLVVKAVRGPLTARIIGRPETAVTDGAILLAAAPALVPQAPARDRVLYMPHHNSLTHGNDLWRRAAEQAGLTFVTPQQDVAAVMAQFARAKLVVTEAMHGAIVADTLRIPWVPVAATPAFDVFKWRDWTLSMEVPLEVLPLPASSVAEADRHDRIRRRLGLKADADVRELAGDEPCEALLAHLAARYGELPPPEAWPQDPISKAVRLARRALNPGHVARAAAALRAAAQNPGYLSEETVFRRRLDQMRAAAESLVQLA